VSAEMDVVRELVRLRRGWGLQNRDLRVRVGPELVRLCGIEEADSDRDIREKVRVWLAAITADLPPELAHAASVALGVDRAHQHRRLTQRVESLASEQSWAPRTARRRMDHAFRLVAQAALGSGTADRDDAVPEMAPRTLAAVVRFDAVQGARPDGRVVVLRVPVPRDRFDLLITFESD
jgi:hypothetical protein